MNALVRPALVIFVALSLITGVLYPLAMTGVAQWLFPNKANGSIILRGDQPTASSLIGQEFSQGANAHMYFWGRLSATAPVAYTSFNSDKMTGSSGSNLGPTNPTLVDNVKARIAALAAADNASGYRRPSGQLIPVDLVTSSASGLDPHVSIAAAEYQVPRIAQARSMSETHVRSLVREHTDSRQWGVLGEPVVNVVELNLAIDQAALSPVSLR